MAKLTYKIVGHGPDLVFLHGWGMHSEIWQPVMPHLLDNYRLMLIDLPGHGRNRAINARSMHEVLELLLEVVPDQAGWIGWSLGGQVAMQFALSYPERVNQLMLVASNPCFTRKQGWPSAIRPEILQQFLEELQQDQSGTIQRFIALQFIGTPIPASRLRALQQQIGSLPADSVALQRGLHWLQTVNLATEVTALEMPVKFILGRQDRLVPAELAETLADMGIDVELMADAGHAPFVSHPELFCNVMRLFFNEGADVGY